jgi:hypothetical protein
MTVLRPLVAGDTELQTTLTTAAVRQAAREGLSACFASAR